MNTIATATRVELWRCASCLDGVTIADDFGAIVASSRLGATMRSNLEVGGFIVAALRGDVLVGYATTVPLAALSSPEAAPFDRWHDLPDGYELGAIEVARAARRAGIATALMRRLGQHDELERAIVLAHGTASHWDVDDAGLGYFRYRAMLIRVLSRAGFEPRATDDPETRDSAANFLAVRIGRAAPKPSVATMEERLFRR